MSLSAAEVIQRLQLEPLPGEGGHFKRTYESQAKDGSGRRLGSAIYYLVTPEGFSALHRLGSADEMFHFYAGDPVDMVQITDQGKLTRIRLGADLALGHIPQILVPPGVWQGTRLAPGGKWALLGCSVVPEFLYEDNELAVRERLIKTFPQLSDVISIYTRE